MARAGVLRVFRNIQYAFVILDAFGAGLQIHLVGFFLTAKLMISAAFSQDSTAKLTAELTPLRIFF